MKSYFQLDWQALRPLENDAAMSLLIAEIVTREGQEALNHSL